MPVALISTKTSPSLGPSKSRSSIIKGLPAPIAIAALVFIGSSLFVYSKIRLSAVE
jgi:hypothetical protein